jgi:predicted ribosome-associated RNA-binding protein Tma20
MKRIQNTELWTDGVVKYRKNNQGDFVVAQEDQATRTVEIGEVVELKPVDNDEEI